MDILDREYLVIAVIVGYPGILVNLVIQDIQGLACLGIAVILGLRR